MKTKRHFVRGVLGLALLATVNSQLSTARAQGSLTPPGAPAPTMKSLDQIEARTPISAAPFTIIQPGSYYLTANLTVSTGNAISIATNGVTLDLNGFTISSTENPAVASDGISLGAVTNISIYNGHISSGVTDNAGVYSGSGFGGGIFSGLSPYNVRVSDVTVSGCQYDGIYLGNNSTIVKSCVVNTVGAYGILAQSVFDSTANDCGNTAISATMANNCYGASSGSGTGINTDSALNCYGYSNGNGDGVSAYNAQNCRGHSSGGGAGVTAFTAQNCSGDSSSGDGVHVLIASACYGYSSSGYGVFVSSVASLCYGYSSAASQGMRAWIMNSCDGNSFTFWNKYNMP